MPQVDPMPSPEELKKRREPKYIIDPKEVNQTDDMRVRRWGMELMKKHEHRLNGKWKTTQIVWSGTVDPEDIDIRVIYPFPDLNWVIYKFFNYWCLMLRSKEKMLATLTYAKID